MTRVATSNYAGIIDTTFEWATADADRFDREFDLYRLAQALENHDHTAGKGLAVARVGNLVVNTAQLAAGAVDATKLSTDAVTAAAILADAVGSSELANDAVDTNAVQNLAITAGKLAAGAAVANIGYTPVNKAGDSMTGQLTFSDSNEGVQFAGGTIVRDAVGVECTVLAHNGILNVYDARNASGMLSLVNDTSSFKFKGQTIWRADNDGLGSGLDADVLRGVSPSEFPGASKIPIADGLGKLDAWVTAPSGIPSLLGFWVAAAADIPSGYSRYTSLDGRLPVGAGTAVGVTGAITYIENTNHGTTTQIAPADSGHTHGAAALGVTGNTGGPSSTGNYGGGAAVAADGSHTHNQGSMDVTGGTDGGAAVIAAVTHTYVSRGVVWIRKN